MFRAGERLLLGFDGVDVWCYIVLLYVHIHTHTYIIIYYIIILYILLLLYIILYIHILILYLILYSSSYSLSSCSPPSSNPLPYISSILFIPSPVFPMTPPNHLIHLLIYLPIKDSHLLSLPLPPPKSYIQCPVLVKGWRCVRRLMSYV